MYKKIPEGDAILMKVLVINSTLLKVPENTEASRQSSILDAILLIQIPRGKERTKIEYTASAIEAGFKGVNFQWNVCNLYVMEFYR
ncbi:hypothetical protein WN943_014274 [Citrus x changshan-huyou]